MKRDIPRGIQWLLEEKYGGVRTAAAEKDITRLEKGEHVDYVIGWVNFLGCNIDLSKKPLIPRPETEFWTEKVIQDIRSTSIQCLDIFAGSGCVGIAILKHIPGATVDFAEKEEKFLQQIKISAKLNKIHAKRYRLLQSDIFSNIKDTYDFILANPPYVAESRKTKVQESVLEQEPRNAVFGGRDGLKYIKPFLREAADYVKENGEIWMEFDSWQKNEIEKLLRSFGYSSWKFYRDQYKKWRYVVVKK